MDSNCIYNQNLTLSSDDIQNGVSNHGVIGIYIFRIVLYILTMPLIILLNALVVVAVYKTPELHTPSNVLLCSLALTDLGTGQPSHNLYLLP